MHCLATYLTVHQRGKKVSFYETSKIQRSSPDGFNKQEFSKAATVFKTKIRENDCNITKAMVTFTVDSKSHKFIVIA